MFRSVRGEILPGIVTQVYDDGTMIALTAFSPRFASGSEVQTSVPYEAPFTNRTNYRWWWPQDEWVTQAEGQAIVDAAIKELGSA